MEPENLAFISTLKKKIKVGKDDRLLVHAIADFENKTDLLNTRIAAEDAPTFDCKKGCSHCCNLRVEVLPPEAFYIAKHINSLPPEQRNDFTIRLKTHAAYAKDKTFDEYNAPCAFLSKDGACEIYSVRPHKCRAYLSMDVGSCISIRSAAEFPRVKELQNDLALETIDVYKKKNLVMHPTELTQGVLAAIEDETLPKEWANGRQVFPLLPEKITV